MSQIILKTTFCATTGVLLAFITWSAISDSAVTGGYILSIILLFMMFFVIGQFFVDRWRPKLNPTDFHPSKPWKTPSETTHLGLWVRVGFITLTSVAVYTALAFLLVMTTTARPAFMLLLGTLFLPRIPHLYWRPRGQYESAPDVHGRRLKYRRSSEIDRRARWLAPIAMAGVGAVIASIGMALS